MTAEAGVAVVKDMAVTHEEFARAFARLLPARAAHWNPAKDGAVLRFPWGRGAIEVCLAPESTRRLGMIVLPQTSVTLTFLGLSQAERERFIAQFDRRFQRGGG